MLSTAAIYFIAASQDYSELSQLASSASSPASSPSESKGPEDIAATRNEMSFFIVVGIAYIAVALWIPINKYRNKIPYTIAIIGSLALIVFYVSTRTINIPSIGLQDDVGTMDILAKVLQAAIAAISAYILMTLMRKRPSSPSKILEYEDEQSQKTGYK